MFPVEVCWHVRELKSLDTTSFWLLENLPLSILKVLVLLVPIQYHNYGRVTKMGHRDVFQLLHKGITGGSCVVCRVFSIFKELFYSHKYFE